MCLLSFVHDDESSFFLGQPKHTKQRENLELKLWRKTDQKYVSELIRFTLSFITNHFMKKYT